MVLQHRADVIFFIFRDVDGDIFIGYGVLVFTDGLIEMIGEMLVDFFISSAFISMFQNLECLSSGIKPNDSVCNIGDPKKVF